MFLHICFRKNTVKLKCIESKTNNLRLGNEASAEPTDNVSKEAFKCYDFETCEGFLGF